MAAPMTYWSISSQVLSEEARLLGLDVEILIPEKNLFLIKGENKEVLFKSTDFGGNTALGKKLSDDKELAYTLLARYDMPIPKTLYISEADFHTLSDDRLNEFHFPVIIKPVDGAH